MKATFILRFLLLALLLPHPSIGANKPGAAPNFIFVITDDISHDDLGPYGNRSIKTPHLDRMAARGLVFDNAYLTISSCSPSRCSIITGRYPHNTGAPELHTKLPESQIPFPRLLRDAGYHTVISGKNHMATPGQLGFEEASDGGPSGGEKWVGHLRERPADKPFFFWFAAHDAHHPFAITSHAPEYAPEGIVVPPMLADGPSTRKDLAGYQHEVSRIDFYLGEVMAELDRQELAGNTFVIFCADNGRPFPRCKTYLYNSGIKTPLLISGPGVKIGRAPAIVSSIDFAPTILELAGVPVPPSIQGRGFTPLLGDPTAVTREVAFAERNWHVFQLHERAVRHGDYLYIWNAWPDRHNVCVESAGFNMPAAKELWEYAAASRLTEAQALITRKPQPPEMLFKVSEDPHQFKNLVADAAHSAALSTSRSLLARWKEDTGDSVPAHPTPDRQHLHERKQNPAFQIGDFPGADRSATKINAPGPVRIESQSSPHP